MKKIAEITDRCHCYAYRANIVQHITVNNLVSERQCAYRKGYSTEHLLVHITETWRKALYSGMVVKLQHSLTLKKAFDSALHDILMKKLTRNFGIAGTLAEKNI